ncbi:MAG: YihY/virulence factor BrkB family protein, partial [Dehalococcoidia bacterium]|nr:YihY/virulence factor BrkB family protein [Dehalococcoidia bacterium]
MQNPFHGLTPRHAWLLVWKTVQEFLNDNCTQMAAAISYYVLFSLVPIIVLALGITGLVLRDTNLQQDVVDFLQEYLPLNSQADEVLATQVERAAGFGGALGLFGLAGMLWAGSGMFAVIRRSLDRAFDLEGRRPFIRQKLVDFTMMAVLGTLFLASITATGTLRAVRAYANDLDEFGQLARDLGVMWEL